MARHFPKLPEPHLLPLQFQSYHAHFYRTMRTSLLLALIAAPSAASGTSCGAGYKSDLATYMEANRMDTVCYEFKWGEGG